MVKAHESVRNHLPGEILCKPGPLSKAEQELLKRHVLAAQKTAAGSQFLRSVAELMECHHEHYDGTGHPGSLKGNRIPLESRIFAILEMFAAIADPEKNANKSLPKSFEIIRKYAGTKFDPKRVKVFVRVAATEAARFGFRDRSIYEEES